MQHVSTPAGSLRRITVNFSTAEVRALVAQAAARAVAENRPVSISETVRAVVLRGLEAGPGRGIVA